MKSPAPIVERDITPANVELVRRERVDDRRHRRLVKLLADLLDSPDAPEEAGKP